MLGMNLEDMKVSKLVDNWCVDWDRVKTVYEPSDEPCAHWECSYKHCVYHELYNPDIESTIYTPTLENLMHV